MTTYLDIAGAACVAVGVAILLGVGAGLIAVGSLLLLASWSMTRGKRR